MNAKAKTKEKQSNPVPVSPESDDQSSAAALTASVRKPQGALAAAARPQHGINLAVQALKSISERGLYHRYERHRSLY